MRPDELSQQATTRAEPLPEERAAERGGEDRRSGAEEILAESEERMAEVTDADAPGDAAEQNRASDETL